MIIEYILWNIILIYVQIYKLIINILQYHTYHIIYKIKSQPNIYIQMSLSQLLENFLSQNQTIKKQPSYLDIKNGLIPLQVSYYNHPQKYQNYPTLKINTDLHILYCQQSMGYPVQYSLANIIDVEVKDQNNQISDNIIQQSVRTSSLNVCLNSNSQLSKIQTQLGQIVQSGTVDVSTFSKNSLTNITQYSIEGKPINIKNTIIDPQIKQYIQFQKDQMLIYNKLPHPIRKKKKVKRNINIEKKSAREIYDQFQIIYGLFNSKSSIKTTQNTDNDNNLQKMLQTVSLNNNSYQQLWEKMIGDIKITKQNNKSLIKQNINQKMTNDQFQRALQRIVKQAVQYEKQIIQIKQDQNQIQGQQTEIQIIGQPQQQMIKMQQQEKEKEDQKNQFKKIKINKKNQLAPTSRYQYAIQDNSDLTNFYDLLPKQKFACQYKFQLDQFQKRSILHLQRKQSIFVAAHTSAGKTVVAEYGIALAIKHKRKVIYTSPIKALSNQKYRELSIKFGGQNVGIVTGDVSMNQQASCVIMTTQILRNNLYRGAEVIRDIQWVIFDQVHYINNQQRGVVWEQTIIMLPEHIGIIMLSATVPNYMDFANWVGRTKHRIVYVMKTLHRPVPLEHSLYIFNKFHVIKQANGRFLKQQFNELHTQIRLAGNNQIDQKKAMKQLKKKKIEQRGFYNDPKREQRLKLMNKNAVDKFIKGISKSDMQTAQGRQQHRVLEELIVDCNKKKLLPCVIFTFSKKKINSLAAQIYTYDLLEGSEKSKITRMFASALSNLKPEDQQIDQFRFLKEICLNGYAVHHGDLLPLAKQIVQLLFSQGLIKVLFATETFAMGINMPTKTVIFNSIKKVTGSSGFLRFLNSSQYVQMSGRAGRRGLDQKGTVIIIVKDPTNLPEASQMQKMVDHPGERLQSKFKVTYQIILNLLNSSDFGVTQMIRQSFLENPKFSQFTSNVKSLKQYQNQYHNLSQFECPYNKLGTRILMDQYMTIAKNLRNENEKYFNQIMSQPKNQKGYLPKYAKILGYNNETQIGLVLKVDIEKRATNNKYVQVIIVNKQMIDVQINKQDREKMEKALGIKKKVVLQYDQDRNTNVRTKFYKGEVPNTKNQYNYQVYWVPASMILELYSNKLNSKFAGQDKKQDFENLSLDLLKIPNLNPIQVSQEKQVQQKLFTTSNCHQCQFKEKHQYQYQRRTEVKDKLSQLAKRLDTNELGLMGSFQGMLLLLIQFGFINQSSKQDGTLVNSLTLKGRIAKEVDIFVAQLIVEAVLDPLDYAQIAALLSAFVCDFKPRPAKGEQQKPIQPIPRQTNYTSNLTKAVGKTLKIVQQIVAQEQQLEAYINLTAASIQQHIMSIVNFHLTDTVYKWAIGFDFVEARSQSRAPQGTIVRAIMRLSQLLSNVKSVCRIIGNSQLQGKIDLSLQAIKRDIVFCQSLYLTG